MIIAVTIAAMSTPLRRNRARLVLAIIDASAEVSRIGQRPGHRGLRADAVGTVAVLSASGLVFVTRGLDMLAATIGGMPKR